LHLYYKESLFTKSHLEEQYAKNDINDANYENQASYEVSNKLKPIQFSFTNRFPKISVLVFLSTIGAITLSEITHLLFGGSC